MFKKIASNDEKCNRLVEGLTNKNKKIDKSWIFNDLFHLCSDKKVSFGVDCFKKNFAKLVEYASFGDPRTMVIEFMMRFLNGDGKEDRKKIAGDMLQEIARPLQKLSFFKKFLDNKSETVRLLKVHLSKFNSEKTKLISEDCNYTNYTIQD